MRNLINIAVICFNLWARQTIRYKELFLGMINKRKENGNDKQNNLSKRLVHDILQRIVVFRMTLYLLFMYLRYKRQFKYTEEIMYNM